MPLSEFNAKPVMTKDIKKVRDVGDDKRAQFVVWEDKDTKKEPPTTDATGLIVALVLCVLLVIAGVFWANKKKPSDKYKTRPVQEDDKDFNEVVPSPRKVQPDK